MFYKKIFCRPGEHDLSFPVLIVKISTPGRVELPENGEISMTFDIPEVCTVAMTSTIF